MRLITAVVVLLGLTCPGVVLHAAGDLPDPAHRAPVVIVGNPVLADSLDRIHRGSALWRAALDEVAPTGRRVVVLTSDQVVVRDRHAGDGLHPFDADLLAEVTTVTNRHDGAQVDAVIVAVNLDLLDQAHQRLGLPWSNRDADLDRILVHEIYGHALPYLLAGTMSGRCADPVEGQRAVDSCAIRRENAVRAELGLGQRADPGLLSLAFSRGF